MTGLCTRISRSRLLKHRPMRVSIYFTPSLPSGLNDHFGTYLSSELQRDHTRPWYAVFGGWCLRFAMVVAWRRRPDVRKLCRFYPIDGRREERAGTRTAVHVALVTAWVKILCLDDSCRFVIYIVLRTVKHLELNHLRCQSSLQSSSGVINTRISW